MLPTLLGIGANIGLGAINNIWASERAKEDREQNYHFGELAAQNADKRTRALYNDFYSPEALMRQYKAAGISPGMMFGGTPGQGGMSGASATGAASVQTPFMPMSLLEGAQIENIKAQTEKTKAETKTIEGTRQASISNILADTGLKQASAAVEQAQAAGIKLDNYIKENTKEASIYMICENAEEAAHNAQKAFEEMRSAKIFADVNEQTLKEQIELKTLAVQQLAASISQSKAMTKLTKAQRDQVNNAICQAWSDLDVRWSELDIHQQQADTYSNWITAQIPIIERQLDAKFKELDIANKRLVIDAVTNTIKGLAMGAYSVAAFKGGQGSYQAPSMPNAPKGNFKQSYKDRGKNIYEASEVWGY